MTESKFIESTAKSRLKFSHSKSLKSHLDVIDSMSNKLKKQRVDSSYAQESQINQTLTKPNERINYIARKLSERRNESKSKLNDIRHQIKYEMIKNMGPYMRIQENTPENSILSKVNFLGAQYRSINSNPTASDSKLNISNDSFNIKFLKTNRDPKFLDVLVSNRSRVNRYQEKLNF